jgi:exonuclease SbcD
MSNSVPVKKILVVGDQHLWHTTPENRVDDYMQATLEEFEECFEIAKSNKVDAIILLGDLFEKPEPSPLLRNAVIKLLRQNWNFRIIALEGNHDKDHSNDLDRTALGTLHHLELLEILDYDPSLGIAFHHFTRQLDEEIFSGKLLDNPAIIHCAHASVGDKLDRFGEYIFLFQDTPLHEKTKILLSGHIHHAMEETRSDGKIFINPGAISRRSASKDNLFRQIKVLLLEYTLDDGTIINKEYIPLKKSRPAEEIFNLAGIEQKKKLKENAQDLVLKVSSITTSNWNFTTLDDKLFAIKEAGYNVGLTENAINIAIEAIRQVNDNEKVVKN